MTAKAATAQIDPPEIDTRVAAFMAGTFDEEVAWWLGMANMVASDPVAQSVYLAHVCDADTHNEYLASQAGAVQRYAAIKPWAYRVAVEFAGSKGSKQRRRSMVESYRPEWAHQCARDGVAIALWGPAGVPGIAARASSLKCGTQAFQRVRDAVQNRTTDLIGDYRTGLRWAKGEIRDGDRVDRWETVTGRRWRDAQ